VDGLAFGMGLDVGHGLGCGAVGVMTGINGWVVCTLGGGMVGWHAGGAKGGAIGGGIVTRCGAWCVGGFIHGALDGETVGGTLGLQLFAITVSSSSSSLVRM
jgi:hypothetical protein